MSRYFDFVYPLAAAAACFTGLALGFTVIEQHKQLADQSLAVERRKAQCYAVRVGLETTRRNLIETNHERHRWGRTLFEGYMRDDWHLVNTCASETLYIEGSCAPDDQACMLHSIDWALVNIR